LSLFRDIRYKIDTYIKAKRDVTFELSPLDAIAIAKIKGMHALVFMVAGSDLNQIANRKIGYYHCYKEQRVDAHSQDLWIFYYNTTTGKFLIQDEQEVPPEFCGVLSPK